MIGVLRHQLLNLLIVAFGQFEQRLFGLLAGAAALTANEPATGMRSGTEDAAQDPFDRQKRHHRQDQNDHQSGHAGFDIVVIGLDQHVTLMTSQHRTEHDPGDQQCEE